MLKSILAVIAGIVTLTVSSFAIEWVVNPLLMKVFPEFTKPADLMANAWVRYLTVAHSMACVALGGYVCARVAGRAPMPHATAMGVTQAALTMLAMVSFPGMASLGFWILTAVLSIPSAAVGGRVAARASVAA